ncbi:hypothetical protein JCM10207_005184 [Rhodosporidiobolus poonsookiae]
MPASADSVGHVVQTLRTEHTAFFVLEARDHLYVQRLTPPPKYEVKSGLSYTKAELEQRRGREEAALFIEVYQRALLMQEAEKHGLNNQHVAAAASSLLHYLGLNSQNRYHVADCIELVTKALNWQIAAPYHYVLDSYELLYGAHAPVPVESHFTTFVLRALLPAHFEKYLSDTGLSSPLALWISNNLRPARATFDEVCHLLVTRPLTTLLKHEDPHEVWTRFKHEMAREVMLEQKAWRGVEGEVLMVLKRPEGWPLPSTANTMDVLRLASRVWKTILSPPTRTSGLSNISQASLTPSARSLFRGSSPFKVFKRPK